MHISGAAWFYQKKDCNIDDLPDELKGRKLMGVCIHPKYGGYFSARAVVITKDIMDKPACLPTDVLTNTSDISKLLIEMNTNWKAGLWRDIHPVEMEYSQQAKIYFNTIPKLRSSLINEIRVHNRIISDKPVSQ